jgi:hypothetical protein
MITLSAMVFYTMLCCSMVYCAVLFCNVPPYYYLLSYTIIMHYMQCYITVYNALLFINAILFVIICYIINILTTDNTPNNVDPIITVAINGKTEIIKSGSYNDLVLRNIDYHDPYSLIVLTIQVDPQHSCHITFGDPTTPGITIGEKSMVFTNKEG